MKSEIMINSLYDYPATHFMVLLRHCSTCKKIILAHKYH